jgi:hypothetical protein
LNGEISPMPGTELWPRSAVMFTTWPERRAQVGQGRPRHVERAEHGGVEGGTHSGVGGFLRTGEQAVTGAVDHDVDAPDSARDAVTACST